MTVSSSTSLSVGAGTFKKLNTHTQPDDMPVTANPFYSEDPGYSPGPFDQPPVTNEEITKLFGETVSLDPDSPRAPLPMPPPNPLCGGRTLSMWDGTRRTLPPCLLDYLEIRELDAVRPVSRDFNTFASWKLRQKYDQMGCAALNIPFRKFAAQAIESDAELQRRIEEFYSRVDSRRDFEISMPRLGPDSFVGIGVHRNKCAWERVTKERVMMISKRSCASVYQTTPLLEGIAHEFRTEVSRREASKKGGKLITTPCQFTTAIMGFVPFESNEAQAVKPLQKTQAIVDRYLRAGKRLRESIGKLLSHLEPSIEKETYRRLMEILEASSLTLPRTLLLPANQQLEASAEVMEIQSSVILGISNNPYLLQQIKELLEHPSFQKTNLISKLLPFFHMLSVIGQKALHNDRSTSSMRFLEKEGQNLFTTFYKDFHRAGLTDRIVNIRTSFGPIIIPYLARLEVLKNLLTSLQPPFTPPTSRFGLDIVQACEASAARLGNE